MLSHSYRSEHIRPGGAIVGALTPGRRIAPSGSGWVRAVLETGLIQTEPRGFMRHRKHDTSVAQPEYRRATGHISAGREGSVH